MTSRIPSAIAAGAIAAAGIIAATGASPALAAPKRCTNAALAVGMGTGNAGAGAVESVFVLRNLGRTSCVLGGYPGMAFVSASGATLANRVTRGSTTLFRDPGPRTITLRPRGTASYSLGWTEPQDAPCPRTARVKVTPPGAYLSIVVRTPGTRAISVCKGQPLTVSALVAGTGGAPS